MNQHGRLSERRLPELLMQAHRSAFTGVLRAERGSMRKIIHFRSGDIAFASSNRPSDRLREVLVKRGALPRDELSELATERQNLARALVDEGHLTMHALLVAASAQVEEIVYSLNTWLDGRYELEDAAIAPRVVDLELDTRRLAFHCVLQIVDPEWLDQRIKSADRVVEPLAEFDAMLETLKVEPELGQSLRSIDGERTVGEICLDGARHDSTIAQAIVGLEMIGLVTIGKPRPIAPEPELTPEPEPEPEPAPKPEPEPAPEPEPELEPPAPLTIEQLLAGGRKTARVVGAGLVGHPLRVVDAQHAVSSLTAGTAREALRDSRNRWIQIVGPAGVGKSALVRDLCRQVVDRDILLCVTDSAIGADGVVFLDGDDVIGPGVGELRAALMSLLGDSAESAKLPEPDASSFLDHFRQLLAQFDRGCHLIVWDNLDRVRGVPAELIVRALSLIPEGEHTVRLLTSSRRSMVRSRLKSVRTIELAPRRRPPVARPPTVELMHRHGAYLYAIATLREPATAEVLRGLVEEWVPAEEAERVLAELVHERWVDHFPEDGLFALGVDKRESAAELEPPEAVRRTIAHKTTHHYGSRRTPPASRRTLDDLAPRLHEIALRTRDGDDQQAFQLLTEIEEPLIRLGHLDVLIAARAELDPLLEGVRAELNAGSLGIAYRRFGIDSRAELWSEKACRRSNESTHHLHARWLDNLGIIRARRGDALAAINIHQRAVKFCWRLHDRTGAVMSLVNLARAHIQLGQLEPATDCLRSARQSAVDEMLKGRIDHALEMIDRGDYIEDVLPLVIGTPSIAKLAAEIDVV